MSITITWLGHSAFSLKTKDKTILFDPFLTGNPLAAARADELNPDLILLSHGHGDHVGDIVSIAKRTGAQVVTNAEIGKWLRSEGVENVIAGNTGGTWRGDFLDVRWTIAHHSSTLPNGSSGGSPNGFIVNIGGSTIYFAGDTDLFLDMQLIGDKGIDLAFLPIGDFYTMGLEDSIRAIQFVNPKVVIPMHYNTWPAIMQDVAEWANRVNSITDALPVVLDPGGTYVLD